MAKISVVINTLNEEKNLPRALASVEDFADEVVVCDMRSDDNTRKIAKDAGAKVYEFDRKGYVEPARNYAIKKATGDWILVLDADEILPEALAKKLKELIKEGEVDYYRLPRKNIVFGKWLKHSRWWPDFNIRFFKKGHVSWNEVIHSVPMTTGRGTDLEAKEKYAILHDHYKTIDQYLQRLNRYTDIQANRLIDEDYKFIWKDLIRKPTGEFLSRYFAGEGYKDGLHGLALALLQSFSEIILYLKVWQHEKFLEQFIKIDEVEDEIKDVGKDSKWWLLDSLIKERGTLSSLPLRIKRKLLERK